MTNPKPIIANLVAANKRSETVERLFGTNYWPLIIEPTIYQFAERLCPEYSGGNFLMFTLSNGGFFMYPEIESPVNIISPNGWSGEMSEVDLGETACLFAYSHLSFSGGALGETMGQHYHWLRDFVLEQPGSQRILAAID